MVSGDTQANDRERANKVMHLSAIAYNLKKYLKFTEKRSRTACSVNFCEKCLLRLFFSSDTISENDFTILKTMKKSLVRRLIMIGFFGRQGLVQRLPMLQTVFIQFFGTQKTPILNFHCFHRSLSSNFQKES